MNDVFYLTEEQRMIRDLARKVARDRIAPNAAQYDESESYPIESMRALVDSGLFGIWVPEEYGGTDMGCLALSLVAHVRAAVPLGHPDTEETGVDERTDTACLALPRV